MQPYIVEYQWIVKRKWTPKAMKALRRRSRRAAVRKTAR